MKKTKAEKVVDDLLKEVRLGGHRPGTKDLLLTAASMIKEGIKQESADDDAS